jgi:hypothetical protein
MDYIVTVEKNMLPVDTEVVRGSKKAEAAALAMCRKYPGHEVYVSWHRAKDGQDGYLNRGGRHDQTAEDWNA